MTETNDNAIFDYNHARILAMYADGCSVAEIGADFHHSSSWVYQQMRQHPERLDEAKARRQQLRTSKYRRIGSISQDCQIRTLEKYIDLLDREDDLLEELNSLREKDIRDDWRSIKEAYRTACSEAAKEENPRPAPPDEVVQIWRQEARMLEIEEALDEIKHIRGKIKDISLIGSAAEKQADLDEGKPTERVDNQGVQIVTFQNLQQDKKPINE